MLDLAPWAKELELCRRCAGRPAVTGEATGGTSTTALGPRAGPALSPRKPANPEPGPSPTGGGGGTPAEGEGAGGGGLGAPLPRFAVLAAGLGLGLGPVGAPLPEAGEVTGGTSTTALGPVVGPAFSPRKPEKPGEEEGEGTLPHPRGGGAVLGVALGCGCGADLGAAVPGDGPGPGPGLALVRELAAPPSPVAQWPAWSPNPPTHPPLGFALGLGLGLGMRTQRALEVEVER